MKPSITGLFGALIVLIAMFLTAACGSRTDSVWQNGQPLTLDRPDLPAEVLPFLAEDPFAEPKDGARQVSAVFSKYFLDSVNHQSMGRWTADNVAGPKAWTLSNTAYSAPKGFVIGANYKAAENDTLTSRAFTIPAGTSAVKLAFFARWSIGAGDTGKAQFSDDDGQSWQDVTTFTGGINPSYPQWDKYLYFLPLDGSQPETTCRLRFAFNSTANNIDWGLGVDSVVVYQTQLAAPINLTATAGNQGEINVDWDLGAGVKPDGYRVLRSAQDWGWYGYVPGDSEDPAKRYFPVADVAAPATQWADGQGGEHDIWYYQVEAYKAGYASTYSGPTQGSADAGSWSGQQLNDYGEPADLIMAGGFPAVVYRGDGSTWNPVTELGYVRATDPDGTGGWDAAVQLQDSRPASVAVGFTNGTPALVRQFNGGVSHLLSVTATGQPGPWVDTTALASDVGVVDYGLINGNPAFLYSANDKVNLVRALDFAGATWAAPQELADGNAFSDSFIDCNGTTCILYLANGGVSLIRPVAPDGSGAWSTPEVVVAAAGTVHTDLAGNLPSLVYTDAGNLNYLVATDAGATGWAAPVVIGPGSFTPGDYAVVDGHPTLVYTSEHNTSDVYQYPEYHTYLSIREATDATGTVWSKPVTPASHVAEDYFSGIWEIHLLDVGGKPALAYQEFEGFNGIISMRYLVRTAP